jgi:hypothetical protein
MVAASIESRTNNSCMKARETLAAAILPDSTTCSKLDTDTLPETLTLGKRHNIPVPRVPFCKPPNAYREPAVIEVASPHDSSDPTDSSTAADAATMLLALLQLRFPCARTESNLVTESEACI